MRVPVQSQYRASFPWSVYYFELIFNFVLRMDYKKLKTKTLL